MNWKDMIKVLYDYYIAISRYSPKIPALLYENMYTFVSKHYDKQAEIKKQKVKRG